MKQIKEPAILSIAYFPNIQYISKFFLHKKIIIDIGETYLKQSFRNRCEIYGANGVQSISVPIIKSDGNRTKTKDILIEYKSDWRNTHWKAIKSAYGHSPFFEIFEPEIAPVFYLKHKYLIDLNFDILNQIFKCLGLTIDFEISNDFLPIGKFNCDYRLNISPKKRLQKSDPNFNPKEYFQVFNKKHGFIKNLSFIDLMFNEGPQSVFLAKTAI